MQKAVFLSIIVLFMISGCAGNSVRKSEGFLPGAEPRAEDEWRGKKNISAEVQDEIIKRISELTEYKEAQKNIEEVSLHRKGVTSIIDNDEKRRGYSVQVGYSGSDRFETYYFFHVDPVTYKITILDITDDEYVTLDTWRKREKSRDNK